MNDANQPDRNQPGAEAELENRLRELYVREEPPAELTARIFERARAQGAARPPAAWLRRHRPLFGLASALIVACAWIALGVAHRRQIETRRAQAAQARLLYALQITTHELNWAEGQVHRDLAGAGSAAAGPARRPKGVKP